MLGFAKVRSIFSFPKHSALIRNSERGVTVSCEHAGKVFLFFQRSALLLSNRNHATLTSRTLGSTQRFYLLDCATH